MDEQTDEKKVMWHVCVCVCTSVCVHVLDFTRCSRSGRWKYEMPI